MGSPNRYPPEVRERAVRMVFSQEAEHDSQWAAICSISAKLGMTSETLRRWVRQAETIIGLYKTEVIRRQGPWKNLDDVEYATLEWVDWINHRRILERIGNIPQAEEEANHCRQTRPAKPAGLTQPSLH